ncbi:MAG: class I SAM-dependent methyltransferase [Terriglobia bacterium]|jgi:O-methyltransferase
MRAKLWNLARLAGPGIFLEVGSFRGGTALHICNAIANRGATFYCFDPLEKGGFENLGAQDTCSKPGDFTDTQHEAVVKLLSSRPNAKVIQGYFPAAAEDLKLHDIEFCHLDVDVYEATKKSLEYLAPRLAPRGFIVLDDMGRLETPGVNKAVAEFLLVIRPFFLFRCSQSRASFCRSRFGEEKFRGLFLKTVPLDLRKISLTAQRGGPH